MVSKSLLLSGLILFLGGFNVSPEPEIKFFKRTHDFGKVKQDGSYSHEFPFVNEGEAPLHVERVKTACNCLTPDWPQKLVQPGDTASINVDFFPTQKGDFFKSIQVHTNLPKQPLQILYVKGHVTEKKER